MNTQQLEDIHIKAIARKNRYRAVSLVADKYHDIMVRHAMTIVREPQEARDICQEVFIKAMREKRFFEKDFNMKAWLHRVTRNLCFNRVRDTGRRRRLLERHPPRNIQSPEQFQSVATNQTKQEILEAIEQLSENHQQILLLRYFQDLSYNEMAQVLQIKLGTVMSRLSRARNQLGVILKTNEAFAF
jgi:RNA polymerase sigma-70 factor (ECF subfamily)